MPTAPKLTAAVAFALVAFFAANAYVTHLPPETYVGWLREITALIGIALGWLVMGRQTGRGYTSALGTGIRTSLMTVFWALLLFSIYLMVKKSMRMMYDGPMEAVLGIFDLMIEHGRELAQADIVSIVFIGGALAGMACEWAGRRWN